MKFIALVLALAFAGVAQAQTVPVNTVLNWTLPTTDTGGAALTGALAITKVQVFLSSATIPATATPTVELTNAATTTTQNISIANGGTLFARLKVCNVGGCSAFTSEVTKAISVPVPNPPTNLTVTVNVTP